MSFLSRRLVLTQRCKQQHPTPHARTHKDARARPQTRACGRGGGRGPRPRPCGSGLGMRLWRCGCGPWKRPCRWVLLRAGTAWCWWRATPLRSQMPCASRAARCGCFPGWGPQTRAGPAGAAAAPAAACHAGAGAAAAAAAAPGAAQTAGAACAAGGWHVHPPQPSHKQQLKPWPALSLQGDACLSLRCSRWPGRATCAGRSERAHAREGAVADHQRQRQRHCQSDSRRTLYWRLASRRRTCGVRRLRGAGERRHMAAW